MPKQNTKQQSSRIGQQKTLTKQSPPYMIFQRSPQIDYSPISSARKFWGIGLKQFVWRGGSKINTGVK